MKGDSGNLTLLLSEAINPSKFVIEHKKWSCLLNPFSMPKSISIYVNILTKHRDILMEMK